MNGFKAGDNCTEIIEEAIKYSIENDDIETIVLAAEWANYTTGYRDKENHLWEERVMQKPQKITSKFSAVLLQIPLRL